MPGPGNSKNKPKKKKAVVSALATAVATETVEAQAPPPTSKTFTPSPSTSSKVPQPSLCLTLDEDEITRCNQPATEGYPRPERCKTHHAQYKTLYKKYKDASKIADDIAEGGQIPTKDDVAKYTDISIALEKARYLRKWIEAIRVERTGRDIHSRRFFLKVDSGHTMRLKILKKQMLNAVEALELVQGRARELYHVLYPQPSWEADGAIPSGMAASKDALPPSVEEVVHASMQGHRAAPVRSKTLDDSDLIALEMHTQKSNMVDAFASIFGPAVQFTTRPNELEREQLMARLTLRQYSLRIIFYEPNLFVKAIGKVSWKDFVLSEDFSMEDSVRFVLMMKKKLGIGLLWIKDAILEAIALVDGTPSGNIANFANSNNRIKVLDGWIYNVPHMKSISNEAWFRLLESVGPVPANIENRFVRLCNTYDDLLGFLSSGSLGSYPAPSFCGESEVYRKHLSLAGVVITDMIDSLKPSYLCGPFPSTHRASKVGFKVWGELESRAYMFGAVRSGPDTFTDAFLEELRAHPDLFHFLTQESEDPAENIKMFGAGPNQDILPHIRARNFEAPSALGRPTAGHGDWQVGRSAKDILYGTDPNLLGYLTELNRGKSAGWFFHFRKFPVRYILIIDPIPDRSHVHLSQQVAWAALRVRGYGSGEFSTSKYAKASDEFFGKCAQELLAWKPRSSWSFTKMSKET